MLSIGKIALGQHRYYEQQVAAGGDDYYSGRGEAPGRWIGAGAEALGLSGSVSTEQFNALIAGHDPREPGERLRSSSVDLKVAAFDLTFSAPKSVSVMFAIAPEVVSGQLVACHEEAVAAALSYVDDVAVRVRRGHSGARVEPAQGLIAAAYRHRMSRALDPQLHTHVVAGNLARGPDGRFTALHGTALYRVAKTAGFLYQAHLRALVVERLGLEWGGVRKGAAELAAVGQPVVEHFSKRRAEMLREAAEGGIGLGSKAAAEQAAIATRERKQYGIETHTWREEVQARAGELGLGRVEVLELLGDCRRPSSNALPREDEQVRELGDRLASPHGLTERSNTFDERQVLQEFAGAAGQGALIGQVRDRAKRFARREEVLTCREGEMTTDELVGCEQRLIAAAIGRAGEGTGIADAGLLERAIGASDRSLTSEQAQAVRAVVSSGDGVSVIQALAGTGKTYTAGALREIYERAGYEVIGVAPTGRAARELAQEAGLAARTLDGWLCDTELRGDGLSRRCVVILDEAAMAATRPTARLLERAKHVGAKVVAIGDPGQLPSVQAGGWLGAVGRALGATRLTGVVRQRDTAERRALGALHEGRPGAYVHWAEAAGRIEITADMDAACEQALCEWAQASACVGVAGTVIIARDNATREALNRGARELRSGLGALDGERAFGSVLVAVGDRVVCRRNDRAIDVDNGTRGTVLRVTPDRVRLQTDGGSVRELPSAYVGQHLEHAYALTGHGLQGATVEAAFVLASPEDLTAGWSYTALSRARAQTRLLLYDRDPGERRDEYAPASRTAPTKGELLVRTERRMIMRDEEELALARLPGASGDSGLAVPIGPPEARGERARGLDLPGSARTRTEDRLVDIDERVRVLQAQRERLAHAGMQGEEPRRRLGRARGAELGLAHVRSALQANGDALDALLTERRELLVGAGHSDETRSERGLKRARRAPEREPSFGLCDATDCRLHERRSTRDADLGIDL
jgi:conjugative relaxase-like TrwC/TraI family protein